MSVDDYLEFRSDSALNLHNVLYSEAWALEAAESDAAAKAQGIIDDLGVRDATGFRVAVDFYQQNLIGKDLLFDATMRQLSSRLVGREGDAPEGWSEVFDPVVDEYLATDWPAHQAQNTAWTQGVTAGLTELLPGAITRLEDLFGKALPDAPILVSTVLVGRTGPAYTAADPAHVICSTSHRKSQGLAAVEIVLHEACHLLAAPLCEAIDAHVDPGAAQRDDLWHVVLFYSVGEVVAQAWAERGVEYVPYLEATGLFDRAWPGLRRPVETAWSGYLAGSWDWDSACERFAAAVVS